MAGDTTRLSIAREPGDHRVTFTVTIAKAISAADNDSPVIESTKKGKKLAVYESPKAQNYYHLEYKLLPDDLEPVRTDVVMYGMAAKIYHENDSKVLKTWKEGDKVWIAWTQSVTMLVTKELLLKLFEHTVELRMWDSKDKVSPRARFDRPKAFRLPVSKENGEEADEKENENVKALVVKQSLSYLQLQPKESRTGDSDQQRLANTASGYATRIGQRLSTDASHRATTAPTGSVPTPAPSTSVSRANELAKVQVNILPGHSGYWSRMAELAGINQPLSQGDILLMAEMEDSKKRESLDRDRRKKKLLVDELEASLSRTRSRTKKRSRKDEQKLAAITAFTRVHGLAVIHLPMFLLFAGSKSVTKRLPSPIFGLEDLLLTVSLDKPLLSEVQKKELNPMVIKICSANNLPNKPLSYPELQEKCDPVYAQYQFFKQPVHRTSGHTHARNVHWNDINVILLGVLDKGHLQEFLQGPPLQVEIHDRDLRMDDKKLKPELFGENPEDEMINNVSLIAGRRTTHNPFESKQKHWDPYGIAKLDLSELLLGQRYLYLSVPLHSCASPDPTVGHDRPGGSIVGQPGSVDGPEEEPLPAANYLEAESELKVKIEVVHPLTTAAEVRERIREPSKVPVPSECPFTRIIYIFDYNNTRFLKDLQNEIIEINARALELMTLPAHVIEAALSTYKLSEEQKVSQNLDILTGFQVIDGVRHIFVLEGLRDEGMKQLLENVSLDQQDDAGSVRALYKTDMTFSERLYASLDVDLCRIRLHDSLTDITQKPLLYVRDIVPRPCFEGLTRLDKILHSRKLREVVKNDLFPSPEMIVSISREFGVPLTADDFGENDADENLGYLEESAVDDQEQSKSRPKWSPLQLRNPDYLEHVKNRENMNRDFIMENILHTRTRNSKDKPLKVAIGEKELPNHTAHNYSTQTMNSTELSKRKLREILRKDPDSLFTYCPDYNSGSVVIADVDDNKKREEEKEKWSNSQRFLCPGPKTTYESNRHPRKPDSARLDELRKPWRENVLHANILKPTVDRIVFPWKHRAKDMDVITQPADPEFVGTVHLHGEAREQELREVNEKAKRKWESRVVVDDTQFRTHRCLPGTELTERGSKSSNPTSKLEDILKDPPQKYSLNARKLRLEKIPALSTIAGSSCEKDAGQVEKQKEHGGYIPGPFEERNWLIENNRIPLRSDERTNSNEQDFRLVFREKTVTSRRPIQPLLPHERNNHLFATRDTPS